MKRLVFILVAIMLIGILPTAACQKDTVESHTPIPMKDISIAWNAEKEAPDDFVPTPGGGTYRVNVFQQGVENPWPPIESTDVVLGSNTDALNVNYRDYIETAAGETRNNIIRVTKEGGLINSELSLYYTHVPTGLELADGGRGVGLPGTLGAILVIDIASDITPGEYLLEIGIEIDGKDYGTIKCTVKVMEPAVEECPFTGTADQNVFRQDAYFVTLVVEKARVSPSASSLPIPDPTLEGPFIFTRQDSLELVFMTKDVMLNGSVCISETQGGGKIVFTQDWHFSDQTGIGYSNLMRPPGVTVRENRIALGVFKPGSYVIRIAIDNTLVKNLSFDIN